MIPFLFKRTTKICLTLLAILAVVILWQRSNLLALALTRTDPLPETRAMIEQERYAEASAYLNFFMDFDYVQGDPEAQALYHDIEEIRSSWRYRAGKLGQGMLSGSSDEAIGQVAGVATDFFVIGDIRDLAVEGLHLAKGEEVDEVLVALASLGVITSGSQVVSGVSTVSTVGAAAPTFAASSVAKSGLVTLKTARKLDKLPPWLTKSIVKAANTAQQSKSLGALSDILGDLTTLAKTKGGFELLSKTDNINTLKRMAHFSKRFGEESVILYRIGGERTLKIADKLAAADAPLLKQAASFSKGGLKMLDDVGAKSFKKLLKIRKGAKIAYKGVLLKLIAKLLALLPTWLLLLCAALGIITWIPRGWIRARLKRRQASIVKPHTD